MALHTQRGETRSETNIFSHSRVQSLGAMTQMTLGSPKDALLAMLEITLRALEKELGDQVNPRDWGRALVTLTVDVPVEAVLGTDEPSDG